jgi:diadenosine tetraphosphatase ApaH/serine/threonine PP2A family protein phosphatase
LRYLILSDLHANLPATEAVLADAEQQGYDRIVVLGDLVGYGADPNEVVDRTFALKPEAIIRGNHDKVCAGLEPATLFNNAARKSIEWTIETLSPERIAQLAALPQGPKLVNDALEICHGTPFDEDYYLFDIDSARQAMAAARAPICLYGHTHVPAIFSAPHELSPIGEPAADGSTLDLSIPVGGRTLINVGSVGQPRDEDSRAAYGILDLELRTIRLRRVVYDIALAQSRIRKAGLPAWLAVRLERGQ